MKKLIFAATVVAMAVTTISCSKEDKHSESIIQKSELPSESRIFIDTYFSGNEILRIEKDTKSTDEYYEVNFVGGMSVDFDQWGKWTEVDGNNQAIQTGFILPTIVDYVKVNYATSAIESIDKKPYGFDVELLNNIELRFNSTGVFLGLGK
ncbi:PepSY-like domain-containing protein [Pedobacter gandavensis]|uniref:PepSY-like domain-containing protein n=1 Tax=Pedobacter gandavensis TaxID=2679963 RepID=UPI002931D07F|nr:PepSY-like domain-containing protein [Pedobacter gandavensis]